MSKPKVLFVGARKNNVAIPIAGSVEIPCQTCGNTTWFSPATLARLDGVDGVFACLDCTDLAKHEIAMPTKAQLVELKASRG